jgi:calcium/proton exchanger cax
LVSVLLYFFQGASDSWNLPVAFISVILLPIVGNAAEHASAIMFAMKDKLVSVHICVVFASELCHIHACDYLCCRTLH